MNLDPTSELALLEKEYFHLNQVVESFDAKSLTIKAWNVTLAGTLAGAGAFTQHYELLMLAAFASLLFWYIDTYWKHFQYANYRRIQEIENYVAGKTQEIACFQMCDSWHQSYRHQSRQRFYRIMFWPHVLLPHGITFIGMVISYFMLKSS